MTRLGLLLACLPIAMSAAEIEQRKPSTIVILTDDMGYGDVSCQKETRGRDIFVITLESAGFRSPSIDGEMANTIASLRSPQYEKVF